jgi:galactose oxidase-like protein
VKSIANRIGAAVAGLLVAVGSVAVGPRASAQLAADYRDGVIGGNVTFVLRSNPADVYLNIVSLTEGPTCFPPSQPVGCIDVDLQLLWISFVAPGFFGTMPGPGELDATFGVPNDVALDGFLLRDQLIKVVNGRLDSKSNLVRILFTFTDEWHDSVGSINNDRAEIPAVQLDDGRILLAGGGGANLDQCEVYIPWLQEFQPVASLSQGRVGHTVTKLQSGKVLVCGGSDILQNGLSSCELYDPVYDQWSNVGPLGSIRVAHTANLLSDGRVLVSGGSTDVSSVVNAATTALKTTELYDPALTTFSAGPGMARPHTGLTSVTLASGDVLIAGGASFTKIFGIPIPNISDKAQIFSFTSGTFGGEINMQAGRVGPGAALMGSGKVLFAGGIGGSVTSPSNLLTAEVFDPAVPSFASVGSMSIARSTMAALLLPASGKVLVAGGATGTDLTNPQPTDVVEIYDPALTTFSLAAPLALPRAAPGAIVLQNNLAAVFGGGAGLVPAGLYRE